MWGAVSRERANMPFAAPPTLSSLPPSSQDQARALRELCGVAFGDQSVPSVDIYDGDTARSERDEVRARARLLITNPDMLHTSILPFHQQFQRILAGLRYVVVDEAHVYRGERKRERGKGGCWDLPAL